MHSLCYGAFLPKSKNWWFGMMLFSNMTDISVILFQKFWTEFTRKKTTILLRCYFVHRFIGFMIISANFHWNGMCLNVKMRLDKVITNTYALCVSFAIALMLSQSEVIFLKVFFFFTVRLISDGLEEDTDMSDLADSFR